MEDLLAERGVIVSRERVRLWINRFGRHFADCIRRDRPKPNNKWHMDEAVITIGGKKFWLWRAIDADGDVLDILVQARRNTKAAKRSFSRLVKQFGETSESEPLMKCRKRMDDVETGGKSLTRDQSGGRPDCCPDGIRHEGGVTLGQALVWNVETCRPDAKGEIQVGGPYEVRVPMRGTGTEQPVVVMKAL
ncbi:hypothetical protein JOH51_006945 [Rhizobium leguminosarum]|nr:hypothetical protein [Rhizobium leguminosarum]